MVPQELLIHPNMSTVAQVVLRDPLGYIHRPFDPHLAENCCEVEMARRKAVVALHAARNRNEFLLERLHRLQILHVETWVPIGEKTSS
jgi:hypothetical protein